jgi:DNA-binding protein
MSEDYAIYIGGKPFMNYVTAVVMQFTTKGAGKVVIRARGKFISRAIDVAEVVRSRFLRDQVAIENMEIGSEEFKNKEGRDVRVSTLDIVMTKTSAEKVAEKAIERAAAERVATEKAATEKATIEKAAKKAAAKAPKDIPTEKPEAPVVAPEAA